MKVGMAQNRKSSAIYDSTIAPTAPSCKEDNLHHLLSFEKTLIATNVKGDGFAHLVRGDGSAHLIILFFYLYLFYFKNRKDNFFPFFFLFPFYSYLSYFKNEKENFFLFYETYCFSSSFSF